MTDNVLQTLQQLVQDVIAPDVRELKVRYTAFEKLVDERFNSLSKSFDERFSSQAKEQDVRFSAIEERLNSLAKSVDERFNSQAKQSEMQFSALMAAISEAKAQTNLAWVREFSDLRERVAVIESKLPAKAS